MTPSDLDAVFANTVAALAPYEGERTPDEMLAQAARATLRLRHCLSTDPGGCWVVEHDGEVAGHALSIVREGVWGLSLLAVRPDVHARGLGGRLIGAALAYGEERGATGGLILSSPDPKALRLYARSGFDMHPTIDAGGIVDRARIPAGTGLGIQVTRDVARTEAVSRFVRGATHATDIDTYLQGGMQLLVRDDDRGFCVHDETSVKLLAALDDEAATSLLWTAIAHFGPGTTDEVLFLTSGQDWAVRVVLKAGLALTPAGAFFTRGVTGPLRPYLPSGAYL